MMLPNTASNLRESKRNQLKDFVSVAGPLGVSHFLILTATDSSSYLRIAKTPRVSSAQAAMGGTRRPPCGPGPRGIAAARTPEKSFSSTSSRFTN